MGARAGRAAVSSCWLLAAGSWCWSARERLESRRGLSAPGARWRWARDAAAMRHVRYDPGSGLPGTRTTECARVLSARELGRGGMDVPRAFLTLGPGVGRVVWRCCARCRSLLEARRAGAYLCSVSCELWLGPSHGTASGQRACRFPAPRSVQNTTKDLRACPVSSPPRNGGTDDRQGKDVIGNSSSAASLKDSSAVPRNCSQRQCLGIPFLVPRIPCLCLSLCLLICSQRVSRSSKTGKPRVNWISAARRAPRASRLGISGPPGAPGREPADSRQRQRQRCSTCRPRPPLAGSGYACSLAGPDHIAQRTGS